MRKTVLVLIPVDENQRNYMESKAPDARFIYEDQDRVTEEAARSANVIIGNPPPAFVKDSPNLEWLQLQTAGIGTFGKSGALPERTILTNASGAYGLAISEYMLGVLLELYKKLHLYRDNQSKSEWDFLGPVKSIYNATVLIVGAGDIGGEFARRVKALGAYTIGIKRTDAAKPEYLDEVYLSDSLDELLPRADIVALSLPETHLTKKVIHRENLKLLKKDAVLINVGRGTAVDTDALCDALESGELLGAALDVTDPEPLPNNHRLWKIKSAIITPHVSGGFSLYETLNRIIRISAENLERFFTGRPVNNVVDRARGY